SSLMTAYQGRVTALWAEGRMDEAISQYEKLMASPGAPAAGWTEIAKMMLEHDQATGQLNWRVLQNAVDRARMAQPDALDVALLRARLLSLQQQWDEARSVLEDAQKAHPNSADPGVALAALAQLQKSSPKDVQKWLEQAEKMGGNSVEV